MKHRFLISALMVGIAALSVIAIPVAAQAPARLQLLGAETSGCSGCQSLDAAENILGRPGSAGHLHQRRLHRSRIEPAGAIRHPTFTSRMKRLLQGRKPFRRRPQRDAVEFATPGGNVGTGPPGHWGERARRSPRQTSLIIEPENGQTPALTEEGRARAAMYSQAGRGHGETGGFLGRLHVLHPLHHARDCRFRASCNLRQRNRDRSGAGLCGHPSGDGPRSRGSFRSMEVLTWVSNIKTLHGRFPRPMGRQHARHRNEEHSRRQDGNRRQRRRSSIQ